MGKKLDDEYPSNSTKEVEYLKSKGIRYTFVKVIDGITIWKYKKNYELFKILSELYKDIEE